MASREELLQSIHPGMRLDKAFFLKAYGYEISYPGFKDQVIQTLENAGCSQAGQYYGQIIGEFQQNRDKSMKAVAADYVQELDRRWNRVQKEGDDQRERQRIQLLTRKKQLLKSLKSIEN